MNNESSFRTSVKKDISSNNDIIRQYINPGEVVVGFGIGGSESLTIFIKKPGSTNTIVRKILSENLITAKWDRDGAHVMLAPYKKAKKQAIYLKNLPESVKPHFPTVSNIIERKVPKSNAGDSKCNSRSPEPATKLGMPYLLAASLTLLSLTRTVVVLLILNLNTIYTALANLEPTLAQAMFLPFITGTMVHTALRRQQPGRRLQPVSLEAIKWHGQHQVLY